MRLAWVRGNWSSRGPPPRPGWRNPSPWRTIPPPMSLLAFLLVAQTATQDTVRPYLAFPEPGLDDPAAYEGYATRVYQDASHNAFQVYLKGNTGRVVNLWADAANESVGFTVRDSSGRPAELAWGSSGAVVARSAQTRSVSYALELPSAVRVSLFLLGSMRVERDLQYAARDTLPLDATPFPQPELSELIDHVAKLKPAEQARHLSLLGVRTIEALRARLLPHVVLTPHPPLRDAERRSADTTWSVRVEQVSFDGKNHLWLALEGDTRETVPALSGSTVTIRRPAGGPVRLTVRITTDAPALTPLGRAEIFNDEFHRFSAQVRADTAHPLRIRGPAGARSRAARTARGHTRELHHGGRRFPAARRRRALSRRPARAGRSQAGFPAHRAAPGATGFEPGVRRAQGSPIRTRPGGDEPRELPAGTRRSLDLGELARQPCGLRGWPLRHGRERHLGAPRAGGGGSDPRRAQAAGRHTGDSRAAARRLRARPRGPATGGD